MAVFRKLYGTNPEGVYVLNTKVQFDENGLAEVTSEDVAQVLISLPEHFELVSGEVAGEPSEEQSIAEPAENQSSEGQNEGQAEEQEAEQVEVARPKAATKPKAPVRPRAGK